MKKAILFLFIVCSALGYGQKATVFIPANQSVELDYPFYDFYSATINNQSVKSINVSVVDKINDSQVRGFGLGPKGKEDVRVEKGSKLILSNESENEVKISIDIVETEAIAYMPKDSYISFTLWNKSLKSIPLQIPSVMNPNLSPKSRSGVSLKIGQEIFFKSGGKKHLLLKVDNSIKDGEEIDVVDLIKNRKAELGIK